MLTEVAAVSLPVWQVWLGAVGGTVVGGVLSTAGQWAIARSASERDAAKERRFTVRGAFATALSARYRRDRIEDVIRDADGFGAARDAGAKALETERMAAYKDLEVAMALLQVEVDRLTPELLKNAAEISARDLLKTGRRELAPNTRRRWRRRLSPTGP